MTYVEKALLDISSLHAVDEAEHKVWYGGSPDMPEDVTHKVFAFQKLEHVNAGHFVAVPVLQKDKECALQLWVEIQFRFFLYKNPKTLVRKN